MLAKLSVAFNQKLLGNSDLVSNTAELKGAEPSVLQPRAEFKSFTDHSKD
jgi:hypothetical protein